MGCIPSASKQQEPEINDQKIKQRQPKQMSENDKTTIELKSVRDKLMGKTSQLEKQIDNVDSKIRQLVAQQKKERAKFEIEKKKLYQKYLSNIDDKQAVLQKMILEVQQAQIDKDCSEAMKQANNFLQDVQKAMSLEEMQDIQDDLKQNEEQSDQFNELFKNYGLGQNQNELEQEYDKLEAQYFQQQVDTNQIQPVIDQNLVQQNQNTNQINSNVQNQKQPQQQQQKQEVDELDAMLA